MVKSDKVINLINEGNQLNSENRLQEAIEKYTEALIINPNFIPALNRLAEIYERQNHYVEAIKCLERVAKFPTEDSLALARLARVYIKQGRTEDGITAYRNAINKNAKLPIWTYNDLANTLCQANRVDDAISIYQKAIELYPEDFNLYLIIAELYTQVGDLDSAIKTYEQAIQLNPNLPFSTYANLAKVLRQKGKEQEALHYLQSSKEGKEGEIYLKIWNAFNQTSLETLENESHSYPTDIDEQAVNQYFHLTSQYKNINLTSLSDEDRALIETAGLSLNYLSQNQKLVTATGVSEEETQEEEHLLTQQLAAQDGCFYAICPSTGKLLQSNRSVLFDRLVFYYRFVGNEVFYLMIAGNCFQKEAIYFPRLELIVHLKENRKLSGHIKSVSFNLGMTPLKVATVNRWNLLKQYLFNTDLAKKSAVFGINFSTWHHLLNELSGVQKIYESDVLQQIEKFLVIGPEYYGGIDDIFPEISSDKVQRLNYWQSLGSTSWKIRGSVHAATNNEILKNNFFAFKLGAHKVSDKLRDRLYQASRKKCYSDFLVELEAVKKQHFPIFWISFRTHSRTWISQVEGIAHIIDSLSHHFPNLAVVFDGYTRIDINGNLLINDKDEEIIKAENDFVSQIQSLFTQQIKVYNIIGSPMYEVIVWANAIDLYLTPGGSTAAKMTLTVNKPGFLHSNQTIKGDLSENEIIDVPQADEKGSINYSYDFDWRIAYEKLLKIASSIKRDE